jgi:hypothetical protein
MTVDVEPTAPPAGTDDDARGASVPGQQGARRAWSAKRIAVVLAAVAVVGAVLVFGSGSRDLTTDLPATDDPVTEAPPGVPSLTGELEDGYVAFTDPETGISLQHPESWVPLQRPRGDLRVSVGTGNGSGLRVRVIPIEGVVDTAEELVAIQTQTDLYAGPEGVQVVKREAVEVNGMIGISYLARFTDEASGAKVANAQYFLFKGNTMHNLLFQAVPEEDFEDLRPVFNEVLASFQGVPAEAAPAEEAPASE